MAYLLATSMPPNPTPAVPCDSIIKLAALITAAFGLVAALAWNEAIQAIFTEVFGEAGNIPAQLG